MNTEITFGGQTHIQGDLTMTMGRDDAAARFLVYLLSELLYHRQLIIDCPSIYQFV